MRTWVWLVVVGSLLGACQPGGSGKGGGAGTHPTKPASPAEVKAHAAADFDLLAKARDAVILGDIDGAKAQLAALAKAPEGETLPAGWKSYVTELRSRAAEASDVNNVEEAGRKVADVAAECGACHEATSAKVPSTAPVKLEPKSSMHRHAWATARMWDSLVVPDPQAWTAAAPMLAQDALRVRDVGTHTEPMPLDVRVFSSRVHRLATAGEHAADASERADLYGQILGSCAACHRRLTVDPFAASPQAPAPPAPATTAAAPAPAAPTAPAKGSN